MAAGGPAGYHDAVFGRAKRRRLFGQKVDAGMDLGDDLVQRRTI